jgi:pimeloyl-ACP methyl ester carboxylesterase
MELLVFAVVSAAFFVLVLFLAARSLVGITVADLEFAKYACYRIGADDRNANVDDNGERIDVDALQRVKYGYGEPTKLNSGAVLVLPVKKKHAKAVICVPGLGRCADDFDVSLLWQKRGYDALFLDPRRYGRAFQLSSGDYDYEYHYNYTADLLEYGADYDDALMLARSKGYDSFIMCGLSTGGLAIVDWAIATGDIGLAARRVKALLLCSPALRMNAESIPRPVDKIILSACTFLRDRCSAKLFEQLASSVVLARDDQLGPSPHAAQGPTWLDAVQAERGRLYDRFLNPCRSKPTFLGYVFAMLEAQARLRSFAASSTLLMIPAVCFLPQFDKTSPDRPTDSKAVHGGHIDEHLDVAEVEEVFGGIFDPGTASCRRIDCQHEVLASAMPVVDLVLDAADTALVRERQGGATRTRV